VIVPLLLTSLAGTPYASGDQLVFVSILLALNLQTSFLTPPFGFSLFYLKGSAPPDIPTTAVYRGVLPFVAIQLAVIALVWFFPDLSLWLPRLVSD